MTRKRSSPRSGSRVDFNLLFDEARMVIKRLKRSFAIIKRRNHEVRSHLTKSKVG